MAIDEDVLDQLLAGRDPQELFAKEGLLDELKKALSERMLSAEQDDHLESEGAGPQATEGQGAINRRNGSSRKTMLTGTSKVTLDVPRDRAGKRHPAIAQSWRRHWDQVIPFFAFPEGVRRIIYTTNAIEALNSKLRHTVRTRGNFPGHEAAMKLLYLVLDKAADEWKRPPRERAEAKTQFAVIFGERFVI